MKKLIKSEEHGFMNEIAGQPPDVTKKVTEAVIDFIVKEYGVEREKIYRPVFRDKNALVTMIRKTKMQDVFFEKNEWGFPDPFMQKDLEEMDDVKITFGAQGNLFITWFEEIEALDRSQMRSTPLDDDDHLMTMEEWVSCCEEGGFINYDGFAEYSDGKVKFSDPSIYPSMVKSDQIDKTFSHIVWYNR